MGTQPLEITAWAGYNPCLAPSDLPSSTQIWAPSFPRGYGKPGRFWNNGFSLQEHSQTSHPPAPRLHPRGMPHTQTG